MLSTNKIISDVELHLLFAALDIESHKLAEEAAELKHTNADLLHGYKIIGYLDTLAAHKKDTEDNYSRASENFYLQLIHDYPLYPDAYQDLAELFAKNKDPENAISYYELYLKIVPFDLVAKVKLAQQCMQLNKLHPDNPPYPNADFAAALTLATQEKAKENNFRKWYHIMLRKQLAPLDLPITAPVMDSSLDDKILDYADPELSNGAVIFAHRSNMATRQGLHFLAYFYNHKAVHVFEDDFLSLTLRAFGLHDTCNESTQALVELDKCIDKYKHSLSYLRRHLIYLDLEEAVKAKADLIMFLNIGAKCDFDTIKEYRRDILRMLNEDPYIEYPHKPSQLSAQQATKMTAKIASSLKSIEAKSYQGNYLNEIEILNTLIKDQPTYEDYYAQRAIFNLHIADYDQAKLDYSLAILFAQDITSHELYFGRMVVYLTLGDMMRARYDFNNAIYIYNNPDDRSSVIKLVQTLGEKCITLTTLHLENGNFALAEKVSLMGLEKWQCTELYIKHAIACGLQEKYDTALHFLNGLSGHKSIAKISQATINKYIKYFTMAKTQALLLAVPQEECKTSDDKTRRKRHKPPPLVYKSHPTKKSYVSTTHIHVLLKNAAEDKAETDEYIQEEAKQARAEREEKERQRKMREKTRVKVRKAKLRENRKNPAAQPEQEATSSSSCAESDLEESKKMLSAASAKPPSDEIILELRDCEKALFKLFDGCKQQHPEQKFKTYIVGGWVYDRVREHLFNIAPSTKQSDLDTVTDFPMATLQAELPSFIVVPQVRGLLQGRVFGYQVDLIQRQDLSSLSRDVMSRDFSCFYLDENGRVSDPTGFGLMYMKQNILKSIAPVSEVFKKDPLIMLRAIRASTKRNLKMTDLRKQIKIDKHLLVPRIGTAELDSLFHPHRFNVLIKKNFSQQLAFKNYQIMDELGLIEILFPHIYPQLHRERDWIVSQMQLTDCVEWPRLELIYANMIVCAVMPQVEAKLDDIVKARLKETNRIFGSAYTLNADGIATIRKQTEAKLIDTFATTVIQLSLLFSDLPKLPTYLASAVEQWKVYQSIKKLCGTTKVTAAANDAPEDKPELRAKLGC